MAKLTRITGKVFGSAATATIGGIGQFGSAATGSPNLTTDVATIQALPAYLNGWGSAVITSRNFPPIEEVTGVLKTISYQTCYNLQEGVAEYDINTEYTNTSIVKSVNNGIITFYTSLQDNNIGNSLTDTDYWKPTVLNLDNKADVDLANTTPSQTFKDMSMSWGMVDYANGIDLKGLSTYTCPDNGYVSIRGLYVSTTVVLKRNDIPVGNACNQTYASSSCFVPVYKDDVLTIFVTQTGAAITFPDYSTFYPMKGAN